MAFKNSSFSITELLVTITIIGVLSAIAIPNYKKYITKAKINEAMTVIDKTNSIIREYYMSTGSLPTNAILAQEFNTSQSGYTVFLNLQNVATIGIDEDWTGTTRLYYSVKFTFDVGNSGRSYIYVAARANINSITFKCGIWNIAGPASYHINDPSYLPPGCNETSVSSFFYAS
jgi:Tfp pilus assembly protein PilE